jgi:hypothetical protein
VTDAELEAYTRHSAEWRVAFEHDMNDIRRILGESKDIDLEIAEGIVRLRENQRKRRRP